MRGIHIEIQVNRGTTIQVACDSAKELSEKVNQVIEFTFNGVRITTANNSINEMVESYNKQR